MHIHRLPQLFSFRSRVWEWSAVVQAGAEDERQRERYYVSRVRGYDAFEGLAEARDLIVVAEVAEQYEVT